jgi:hypothetical protein
MHKKTRLCYLAINRSMTFMFANVSVLSTVLTNLYSSLYFTDQQDQSECHKLTLRICSA